MLSIAPTQNTELISFIRKFGFNKVTVQYLKDSDIAKINPSPLFPLGTLNRSFTATEFFEENVQTELQNKQHDGCGIFFTVNESDGIPHSLPKLNCATRLNICTLRTLIIDTDNADPSKCLLELASSGLTPHISVCTSPGRFHFYFLIEPMPAIGDSVIHWLAVQKLLQNITPDLDQSMCDINQVLRLPTFYHMKTTPNKVKVVNTSDHPHYNLKNLYERLEAYKFDTITTITNQSTYTPFTFPTKAHSLTEGNRRTQITRYMEHVMENLLPLNAKNEDYWTVFDAFIIKYTHPKDTEDFLTGKRRKNLESYFNDQRDYRLKKQQSVQAAAAISEYDHINALEDEYLPDSFYLNFPGDIGMVTKEIHEYAPNLSLELCFAAALSISGALKADTLRLKGSWPLLNGLIIAGTGAGKSTIKSVVEQSLKTAGLRGRFPQLIGFSNTVQSLHNDLYKAGGVATTLVDESGDYLQSISAKNAPNYAKALKKYFKEATTGRGEGAWLHPGSSMSFQTPPIDGGFLSIWLFIQPDKFTQTLNLEDMADGFLPRFFIFKGASHINLQIEDTNQTFIPSLDMQVWMSSLTNRSQFNSDIKLQEILTETENTLITANPKTKKEIIYQAQIEAVYTTRSENRKMQTTDILLTDDAHTAIRVYLKERETQAHLLQKEDPNNPALGIYIRMQEMLYRLLANVSHTSHHLATRPTVDLKLAEESIKFHRFQTERFFRKELIEISTNDNEKLLEVVKKGIAAACKKSGQPATPKEINACMKGNQRPKNLSAVLKDLDQRGEIWSVDRPHAKFPYKKVKVYSVTPPEDIV